MSATRILLADDHAMVRLGLRTILEDHQEYEVCGEAGDGSQTLALAYQLAPDILIVDISMPPPNGLEVSAQLREAMPTIKVLIITMHDTEEMLGAAAAAGASGYLLKSDSEELLVVALQRLEQGHAFVSPAFGSEARQVFEREGEGVHGISHNPNHGGVGRRQRRCRGEWCLWYVRRRYRRRR